MKFEPTIARDASMETRVTYWRLRVQVQVSRSAWGGEYWPRYINHNIGFRACWRTI
jgi:hypothetical protein